MATNATSLNVRSGNRVIVLHFHLLISECSCGLVWLRGVQLPVYWDWLLSLQGLSFVERMMGLEWFLLSGWLLEELVQNLIPKWVSLLPLKKEWQLYGDCSRCLQGVKWECSSVTGSSPAVPWGTCLTDTTRPNSVFSGEWLMVNPPLEKPNPNPLLGKGCPGTLGCVRGSQSPACGKSSKGTKCLGVGGEAGCCGGAGAVAGGGGLVHPCQVLLTPSPWCVLTLHLHSPSSKMVAVSSVPLLGSRRIF